MEWTEVEPVLAATYRLFNAGQEPGQDHVCAALGRAPRDERTIRALAQLYETGYIGGYTVEESPAPVRITATEKGLQRTSGWPGAEAGHSDERLVGLLLELLDERINDPATPEPQKGVLRKFKSAATEAVPGFLAEFLAAYTARIVGPGEGSS